MFTTRAERFLLRAAHAERPGRGAPMIDGRRALAAVLTGLGLAAGSPTFAADRTPAVVPASAMPSVAVPMNVPDLVPPAFKDAVARVIQKPTLTARGTSGDVACSAEQYAWLLDHPD